MLWRRSTDWPAWGFSNPFDELDRIRRQMDWLSSGLTGGLLGQTIAGVFPLMNMTEDKDNYYIRAELPGIKAKELDISATGDSISIAGERKIPAEAENAHYHQREREGGTFNRTITLPARIDADKVEADANAPSRE
jgi:HSP20 family protein